MDRNAHELALRLLRHLGLGDQAGVAKQERAQRGELPQRLDRCRVKWLIGLAAHRQQPDRLAADRERGDQEASIGLHDRLEALRCTRVFAGGQFDRVPSGDAGEHLGHQGPAGADELAGRGRFDHHLGAFEPSERCAVGVDRRARPLQQAAQHGIELHLAGDIFGRFCRRAQTRGRLVGALPGRLPFFEEPGITQGEPGDRPQQGQCREIRRGEGAILVTAEDQHANGPRAVDEGHDRYVAHVGERLAELRRRLVGCQSATERRLQRVDRLLHQRLTREIIERIALPDPGQLTGLAVGGFDHDVVVNQAG